VLFGIVIMQGYMYFQTQTNDRKFLKVLASIIMILEVAHSIVITHTIYLITVTMAGRTDFGPNSYPLSAGVVFETLITALVQSFFAYRIYRLVGKPYISIVCWALSLLRLGGGLALAAESFLDVPKQTREMHFTSRFGWLITLAVGVGAFVDVLIAAFLCYYLKRLSSPFQLKR